jgi:hypothetical protein
MVGKKGKIWKEKRGELNGNDGKVEWKWGKNGWEKRKRRKTVRDKREE